MLASNDRWVELRDVVVIHNDILGARRFSNIAFVSRRGIRIKLYREDHVTASIDGPKRKSAGSRKEIRHLELRIVLQPPTPRQKT